MYGCMGLTRVHGSTCVIGAELTTYFYQGKVYSMSDSHAEGRHVKESWLKLQTNQTIHIPSVKDTQFVQVPRSLLDV